VRVHIQIETPFCVRQTGVSFELDEGMGITQRPSRKNHHAPKYPSLERRVLLLMNYQRLEKDEVVEYCQTAWEDDRGLSNLGCELVG
jgi:hypothetical protein